MNPSARESAWDGQTLELTDRVRVLLGEDRGAYPSGNSVLVVGDAETAVIDPSLTVAKRGGAPVDVDAVINSHAHEDHMAGNIAFGDARVHIHEADLPGIQSVDGLLDIFGFPADDRAYYADYFVEEFHYSPRSDAQGFGDGKRFDLGGVTLEAMHLPGHTRGHSGFMIDGGVFFLSDIDLTGFGPYYGDVWSDLDDFEESLVKVADVEADVYVTFHHKGVVEGRARFLELLDSFAAVIGRRHDAMLDFLVEPRSVDEMVAHRFIYRPNVEVPFADQVERRSAELHLARMTGRSEAEEVAPGRFLRV